LATRNPPSCWTPTSTRSSQSATRLCLLEGYYTGFSNATLQALYPTHSDYVSAFTSAAASDLVSGFLTQADYSQAVAAAEASTIP
jgi:hypothetical protein